MFKQKQKVKIEIDENGLRWFAVKCTWHGWFIDYVHGFSDNEHLICPRCNWPEGKYSA